MLEAGICVGRKRAVQFFSQPLLQHLQQQLFGKLLLSSGRALFFWRQAAVKQRLVVTANIQLAHQPFGITRVQPQW